MSAGCESAFYTFAAACWARLTNGCRQQFHPTLRLPTSQVQFANAATDGSHLVGFCNEIAIGEDGWAMIAPFGDHPSTALLPEAGGKVKKQPAIQRIDKTGADAMVSSFHNERRGLRKFLKGCNIYVGHPDVPQEQGGGR